MSNSIIQTIWVKPINQLLYTCQLITKERPCVSVSISFDELWDRKNSSIENKKKQLKLSFMDLIETELDKAIQTMKWPEIE